MNNDLFRTFEHEAESLARDFKRASTLGRGTASEVADHRENSLRSLLRRFFPAPHHVAKGQAIDVKGRRSASIDCLVLSPAHPNLIDSDGKFSIILAEAVDFAVEAKGDLTVPELKRFFGQALSIRQLERTGVGILGISFDKPDRDAFAQAARRIPVFCYCMSSSLTAQRIVQEIIQWVDSSSISPFERPDAIVVHDRFIILDTSSRASAGRILMPQRAPGLWIIEDGTRSLGQFLLLACGVPGAQVPIDTPMLSRYAAGMFNNATCLYTYPSPAP
jgi:hypothetical protein